MLRTRVSSKYMWIISAKLTVLAIGCQSSKEEATGARASQDAGGSGSMSEDGSTPVASNRCTSASDCSNGQACHPFLQVCVSPGAMCETQKSCPDASYCESRLGVCLQAATGTPCASDVNCEGTCSAGFCGCDGLVYEQPRKQALDAYLILDRSGSMGEDCAYQAGKNPPVASKACFATYALANYMTRVPAVADTRLAFQFFSLEATCSTKPYATPLVGLAQLPVKADHRLIREISDETFDGFDLKTRMEPALRGIAAYTAANQTPGREMIGVLMTDGDANECEDDIGKLSQIIADHRKATGLKTYIIGMEGASEDKLEQLAIAGGAGAHEDFCGSLPPPCHHWNVGKGSDDAVASALKAISAMATPLPCKFPVGKLKPPPGETLDYQRINVALTQGGKTTTIGQVRNEEGCPEGKSAWFYDKPDAPSEIRLCPAACKLVREAGEGARVNVVVGCQPTVIEVF